MKMLHLTLKKQWFDLIASGEKKEEYREIKPYWVIRLCNEHVGSIGGDFMDKHKCISFSFKRFDLIRFKNGYNKTAPEMDVEFKGIRIGKPVSGLSEEGYLDKDVFIIELGKILSIKNYNQ